MMKYTKACQTGHFESKLFDCCSDYGLCCYVTFCYPCALAHAWSDVRGDECTIFHWHAYEIYVKSNLRQIRAMPINYCRDKRVGTFCPCCSLSQDIREIRCIQETVQNSSQNGQNYIDFKENSQNLDQFSLQLPDVSKPNDEQSNTDSPSQIHYPLLSDQ